MVPSPSIKKDARAAQTTTESTVISGSSRHVSREDGRKTADESRAPMTIVAARLSVQG